MQHPLAMEAFVTMPLRIPAAMAERIDEHWHEHRFMSRAAAIRDILERGLSRPGQPARPVQSRPDIGDADPDEEA
jgi:Arc/MetJ-type ribon-helix-helix transcriptional regulator